MGRALSKEYISRSSYAISS